MRYRERLWPSLWVWILMLALTASVGIAYGAAYGAAIGLITFLPLAALAGLGLVLASPRVEITATELMAGPARIPISSLSRCAALDSGQTAAALTLADPTLFLLVRPWNVRTGVLIELDDPEDPHTAWLVCSRRPEQMAEALDAVGVSLVGDREP